MSGGADPAATVGGVLCRAGQHLRAAAIPAPRLEARLLLSHAMGTDQASLLRAPRAAVPTAAARAFAALLRRRLDGVPMAYLTGRQGFWTLDLHTTPDTLIPRPDTETLVEAALDAFPDRAAVRRVLDLGTGTGALLLAALSEFPGAFGIGVDRAPAAAALARDNAARTRLGGRAAFLAGDWAAALRGRFDLVLCNPPYIESAAIAGLMPEVARHEPRLALDGGADGLDAYRALFGEAPVAGAWSGEGPAGGTWSGEGPASDAWSGEAPVASVNFGGAACGGGWSGGLRALLALGGRAVLELGAGQRESVSALARAAGLEPLACRADLGGIPRALVLL